MARLSAAKGRWVSTGICPSATGWQTTDLTSARQARSSAYPESVAFDPDLDHAVLYQNLFGLTPLAPAEYPNLYTQSTSDPLALSPLLTEAPPDRSPGAWILCS